MTPYKSRRSALGRAVLASVIGIALAGSGFAQTGSPTYVLGIDPATGYIANADETAVEPNGELLADGTVGYDATGLPIEGLVLFEPNGTVDPAFNATALAPREISMLQVLPSGQALVVGTFGPAPTTDDDPDRLVRLNADGSVDTTFDASALPDTSIDAMWVQPDGGILLCITGTDAFGNAEENFLRLNSDGSADATFQPAPQIVSTVLDGDLLVQPNGQLLVYSGAGGDDAEPTLLRLNSDGSQDTTFQAALAAGGYVTALALQPNGQLLVGQEVAVTVESPDSDDPTEPLLTTTYLDSVIRLNTDGTADPAFAAVTLDGEADTFGVQPDGQVLLEGDFDDVDNTSTNGIARLNADGTLDTTFLPLAGISPYASQLFMLPDGSIFVSYGTMSSTGTTTVLDQFLPSGSPATSQTLSGNYELQVTGPGPGFYVLESSLAPPPGIGPVVVVYEPTATQPSAVITLKAIHKRIGTNGRRWAKFMITRTGSLKKDLKVAYTAGGTALSGRDYTPLKGTKIIRAGRSHAQIRIKPVGQHLLHAAQQRKATLQLSILPGTGYGVGTPSRARVKVIGGGAATAGE